MKVLGERSELLPYKGDFYLWSYVPSMAAAVIFLLIFLGLSLGHTWKMWHHRMWFCSAFVIGGYMEVVGFIGRAAAHNATDQLMPYILQSLFLLVPPSLFAASIYMTLGRIIRGLGHKGALCSIIKVRWLTTTFVTGDAFSFLVQSSGAGLMAAGNNAKMGENIVVTGLFIQIIFFGIFVAAAVMFHIRYRQYSIGAGCDGLSTGCDGHGFSLTVFPGESIMWMLYGTSLLILVRSIFRIIEYVMGSGAYPLKNEWTLYVFDALLMAVTMSVFYIWYPSNVPTQRPLDQVESTEMN